MIQGVNPGMGKRLYLIENVQTSAGAYIVSYSVGSRDSVPRDKVAGA